MDELVAAGMFVLVVSVAVIVHVPESFRYKAEVVNVPPTKPESAGKVAPPSVEVKLMVSVEFTMLKVLSTALMVTLTCEPAGTGVGVPTFPVRVFGALVSPGNKTCNWVN